MSGGKKGKSAWIIEQMARQGGIKLGNYLERERKRETELQKSNQIYEFYYEIYMHNGERLPTQELLLYIELCNLRVRTSDKVNGYGGL